MSQRKTLAALREPMRFNRQLRAVHTEITEFPTVTAAPISAADFATMIKNIELPPTTSRIAVSVSGGSDSMALVLLLKEWARPRNIQVFGLIVDHKLRPESTEEAHQVQAWLHALDVNAEILTIDWSKAELTDSTEDTERDTFDEHHDVSDTTNEATTATTTTTTHTDADFIAKNKSRMQHLCRQARYSLLAKACRNLNIKYIFAGHHMDDQVETVLYRFAHKTGIDGLAGMAPMTDLNDIVLCRPLLIARKDRLIATCVAHNQKWVEDPSNTASQGQFRTALRRGFGEWAEHGITIERINDSIVSLFSITRQLVNNEISKFLLKNATWSSTIGYIAVDRVAFLQLPKPVAMRLYAHCVMWVTNRTTPPRKDANVGTFDRLIAACTDVATKQVSITLNGAIATVDNNMVIFSREHASKSTIYARFGETVFWDNRYEITVTRQQPPQKPLAQQQSDDSSQSNNELDPVLFVDPAPLYPQQRSRTTPPKAEAEAGAGAEVHANQKMAEDQIRIRKITKKELMRILRECPRRKPTWPIERIPRLVQGSLPAVLDSHGLLAVPFIGYKRESNVHVEARFVPRRRLVPPRTKFSLNHMQSLPSDSKQ